MQWRIFFPAFEKLFAQGDFFTLNVSSPNTPNLRDLQEKSLLRELLLRRCSRKICNWRRGRRLNRKRFSSKSPRISEFAQVDEIIDVVEQVKLTGIVAANATAFETRGTEIAQRRRARRFERPADPTAMVTQFISHIYRTTHGRLPIIGVGGIFDAYDAYEKIKAGANAVQIYTGWIYEGPGAVKRINKGLLRLLQRDGLKHISEAVGQDLGD